MKFLVLGCGSIGLRHIKNLIELGEKDIICFDTNEVRLESIKKELKLETSTNIADSIRKADVILICSPSNLHSEQIRLGLENNKHIFVEKPVAHDVKDMDALISIAKKKNRVTLVACNMRFHQGIKKIKELINKKTIGKILFVQAQGGSYLPDWHPKLDYRKGYSANKSMGGGILLDGIHEIDYLRSFFGDVKEVQASVRHISSLEIDTEDFTSLIIEFDNGVFAELHLDYVQRAYTRTCRVIGEEGTIEWDFNKPEVNVYESKKKKWKTISLKKDYKVNDMYLDEMKHFINCLKRKENSEQDLLEGKKAVDIVIAAKESERLKRRISL